MRNVSQKMLSANVTHGRRNIFNTRKINESILVIVIIMYTTDLYVYRYNDNAD